ncbi:MAG: hypothetical protein LBH17_00240 [Oscillospiraceae bacterium]|jgi:hypothetical protein|nr:hypothetical protein [Oscillospiraceae bacterium]
MKKSKRFVAAFLLLLLAAVNAAALDTDEYSGLAADTLTVSVGYFGGEYETRRVFTLDELWALDVVYQDYTFIDNMPSVVIDHVAGVTLADLLEAAGIDIGSVQSFNFWTNDKAGGYYTSLTKTYLIDTPRYCYYSLPDNFDYDHGRGNEYAALDQEPVQTVIALADDWNRALAGASFGSDYMNLNTNTRFRLIFGQTDAEERTASSSAKWIHKIEVTLGGAPPAEPSEPTDDKVGSEFNSEEVGIADDVPTEGAATPMPLESASPSQITEPASPEPEPQPVTDPNPPPIKLTRLGYQIQPAAKSENDDGGVQQWRRDEMADDAVALTEAPPDAPVIPAALAALTIFALGAITQVLSAKRG